jgi:hypothetical protein
MVALANIYTLLDVSIQQFAVGLAILASLVALTWYVSRRVNMKSLATSPIATESRYVNRKAA